MPGLMLQFSSCYSLQAILSPFSHSHPGVEGIQEIGRSKRSSWNCCIKAVGERFRMLMNGREGRMHVRRLLAEIVDLGLGPLLRRMCLLLDPGQLLRHDLLLGLAVRLQPLDVLLELLESNGAGLLHRTGVSFHR